MLERFSFLARFLAGFCLIANGAYIGFGSFEGIGDAGKLLRLGSSPPLLWGFGLLTIPTGFWVWHGAGADFGFGPQATEIDPATARLTAILLILIVGLELLFGHTLNFAFPSLTDKNTGNQISGSISGGLVA